MILCLSSLCLQAQITIIIDQLPSSTPSKDSIYITGSFNGWKANAVGYRLQKNEEGKFATTLPDTLTTFEYKFTRGSWKTVEGGQIAEAIPNRQYIKGKNNFPTHRVEVLNWEDIPPKTDAFFDEVTFIVEHLPDNTPHDASIFIVGNFNGWHPGTPDFKLRRNTDSTYSITIPIAFDTLQYKFTRGNWSTAEGRKNGRAIPNRTYIYDAQNTTVRATVETWEDFAGGIFNLYTFILLLAASQGLLLMIAINTLPNNNEQANLYLSMLIGLITIALLSRVATFDREIFQQFPKLLLVPDFIYFLYGPLFLMYMRELLTLPPKGNNRNWLHFVPFGVQAAIYASLFFIEKQHFITKVVDYDFHNLFAVMGGLALLFNAFYWFKCLRLLQTHRQNADDTHSIEQNLHYLNSIILLKGVCLALWALTYGIAISGMVAGFEATPIVERIIDFIWVLFSLITYFLGYFAMSQPQVFKLPEVVEKKEDTSTKSEEILQLKSELQSLMYTQKPYKNPKLTLADLADLSHTSPHTLSRVINEGFEKNFFDFVNAHRVEEFKQTINKEKLKTHTILGVALEAGFNSKTAFNRSFKKMEGMTPRQFLQQQQSR